MRSPNYYLSLETFFIGIRVVYLEYLTSKMRLTIGPKTRAHCFSF